MNQKSTEKFIQYLFRMGLYSFFNSHKYKEDSIIYPYINFKYLLKTILMKNNNVIERFDYIKKIYASNNNEILNFNGVKIPMPQTKEDIDTIFFEIRDLIIPYLINDKKVLHGIVFEGPYELENVFLEKGDVVIDAGANMGLFSAIAVNKGCTSIAFEPIPYVIDNFLIKTQKLNENIKIAPFALSNISGELTFKANFTGTGASHRIDFNITPPP